MKNIITISIVILLLGLSAVSCQVDASAEAGKAPEVTKSVNLIAWEDCVRGTAAYVAVYYMNQAKTWTPTQFHYMVQNSVRDSCGNRPQ